MFEFCTDNLKQTLIPARTCMKELEDLKSEAKIRSIMSNEERDVLKNDQDSLRTDSQNSTMMPTGWYNLHAVLTHIGRSADSGHYIAWVRSQHDKNIWWKFDDDTVTAVRSEDISKLDGGGDWHVTYLCLYQQHLVPMAK